MHVWYVSYGSNMYAARFACYLRGGSPEGASRTYPGCRDTTPPTRAQPFRVRGGIYFATHSPVWGGGRAFLDTRLERTAAGRAYLVTWQQFSDVVEQEMYREPGTDHDFTALRAGARTAIGPGRYETVVHLGDVDGFPALTFTAPWRSDEVEQVAPSGPYLKMLRDGLREAHAWTAEQAADYLATCTPHWTTRTIEAL
jgi:hypothetical protein